MIVHQDWLAWIPSALWDTPALSLALSFPQSISEWVNLSLLCFSLSFFYESSSPQRMSQARGLRRAGTSMRATQPLSKPPDNQHMQTTAAANARQCPVVPGHFGGDDSSPLRQQRGCGKDCTLSAPAGSAAMQGCNRETGGWKAVCPTVSCSLSLSLSLFLHFLPCLTSFLSSLLLSFLSDHFGPFCLPAASLMHI